MKWEPAPVTDEADRKSIRDVIPKRGDAPPEPFLPPDLMTDDDSSDKSDWHERALLSLATQLGVGNDFYYPLLGAASKLKMYHDGETYEAAKIKEG